MFDFLKYYLFFLLNYFNQLLNHYLGYNDQLLMQGLSLKGLNYLLDSRGVSPAYNANGYNALHAAAITPSIDLNQRLDILLRYGVDVNSQENKTEFRNTPLHLLIANENIDSAIYLINKAQQLKKSVDYNKVDSNGATLLLLASKMRLSKIALHILSQKSKGCKMDVNKPDNTGMSPLHYAAALGQLELAKALYQHGANSNAENDKNETLIDVTNYTEDQLREILLSVEIDPDRDEKATLNRIHDQNKQTLIALINNMPFPVIIPSKKDSKQLLEESLKLNIIDSTVLLNNHRLKSMG